MRKVIIALGLALAMLATPTARAQRDISDQLLGADDSRIEVAGARLIATALDQVGRPLRWRYAPFSEDVISLLAADEIGHREVYRLEAGREYLFQGACDRACGDLGLEVTDGQGVSLGRDVAFGAPMVTFTPPRHGYYTVRIWLTGCAASLCYAGIRGYSRAS